MFACARVSQVLSITTFISGLMFNLVVSIAMANISTALSVTAWSVVGRRIWLAIFTALVCGGLTGVLLMLLETPIFDLLLFTKAMRLIASPYWLWRCATIPAILVLRVLTGVLGGFQRSGVLTALSFVSCAMEGGLSAFMLFALDTGLDGVGFSSCVVNGGFAVLLVLALPAFTPPEARGRISLWADLPCCVCLCRRKVESARLARNQPLLYDMGEPQAPRFTPFAFLRDGSDTIIRYVCLQGSLLAVTICASRMGENMLAVHHILVLLWMITSYIIGEFMSPMCSSQVFCKPPSQPLIMHAFHQTSFVVFSIPYMRPVVAFSDGFSDVGTLTASRMLAARNYAPLKRMFTRLALFGLFVGLLSGVLMWFLQDFIVLFLLPETNNVVKYRLDQLWPLVCIMQVPSHKTRTCEIDRFFIFFVFHEYCQHLLTSISLLEFTSL